MFEEGGGGGTAQVITAELTSAANEAASTADNLDTMLSNLVSNLAPLESAWRGSGGMSYQSLQLLFEEEMKALDGALRSLGGSMGIASTNYDTTDEDMRADLEAVGATSGQITRLLEG